MRTHHGLYLLICVVLGLAIAFLPGSCDRAESAESGMKYTDTVAEISTVDDTPRLLRLVDKDAGVVCYILQNDAMTFLSGLQCIPLGNTRPAFWSQYLRRADLVKHGTAHQNPDVSTSSGIFPDLRDQRWDNQK